MLRAPCRRCENQAFGIPVALGGDSSHNHVFHGSIPEEANMSAKQRRKIYGVRRETRRPRGWTRWFHEGMLDAESSGGVRLRTILWGKNGG
jgi:hypothetical protein